MTRTETDLAHTIAASADVVVDTDRFVTKVKHRARRRRRLQFAIAGAGTAVVAVAVAVPVSLIAAAPTESGVATPDPAITTIPWPRVFTGNCTTLSIPMPLDVEPGLPIQLIDMDPTGRYITGSYGPAPQVDGDTVTTGGPGLPVLWDNGIGRVLPVSGENIREVSAVGVNQHGSVVGSLRRLVSGTAAFFGWVSMDGTEWDLLPTPEGYREAYAVDINDRGEIAGVAHDDYGMDPVVWSVADHGRWAVRVIEAPNWNGGTALAITDDGTVVGNLLVRQPFVWDAEGSGWPLPLPEGTSWGNVADASGDWAVGFAGVQDEETLDLSITHLLRWDIRTGEMSIMDTDFRHAWGATVNARGDVAWISKREYHVAALPDSWPVLVTRDGQEYELPIPDEPSQPIDFEYQPVAMADDATLIAGYGVLWRC